MRKSMFILPVLLLAAFLQARSQSTAANLLNAYKSEFTASAKYSAYAEKAVTEGFPQVALLFRALAKSEGIHAANHKTVLERMGQKADPFKPEITVKSTKENLDEAIRQQTAEVMTTYPAFINVAKNDKESDAVKSMRWAMDTGKRQIQFLQDALFAVSGNSVAQLPKTYWICPKCGNTYNVAAPEALCSFCSTASGKFIRFT